MFINGFLFHVLAKQCDEQPTKQPEELEKKHVVKMLFFFAIWWTLAGFLNCVNAFSPRSSRSFIAKSFYDFTLGALFGVQAVIFVHYGIGFFVPQQDDSLFIRVIAFTLNVFGTIVYGLFFWIICTIWMLVRQQQARDKKRLLLVTKLQGMPFSRLAFDSEMQCIICFTNF